MGKDRRGVVRTEEPSRLRLQTEHVTLRLKAEELTKQKAAEVEKVTTLTEALALVQQELTATKVALEEERKK